VSDIDPIIAASDVADKLLGSCMSLDEGIEACGFPDSLATDSRFCAHLDSLVQECDSCSWWFEPSEIVDEGICESCCEDE